MYVITNRLVIDCEKKHITQASYFHQKLASKKVQRKHVHKTANAPRFTMKKCMASI